MCWHLQHKTPYTQPGLPDLQHIAMYCGAAQLGASHQGSRGNGAVKRERNCLQKSRELKHLQEQVQEERWLHRSSSKPVTPERKKRATPVIEEAFTHLYSKNV